MGQRHVCTFRHVQRAAYRTAISAAQILVTAAEQHWVLAEKLINRQPRRQLVNAFKTRCKTMQEIKDSA